jgi:hypothetical protein
MNLTKTRLAGLFAGAATSAICLMALPAGAAHAQEATASKWPYYDPSTLPDLGTCPPMSYGYSVNTYGGSLNQDPCVGALQYDLLIVGFSQLGADGEYGPQTWTDVWNFQTAHQLPATGNADAQTIALLDFVANSPEAITDDNGAGVDGGPEIQPSVPPVPIARVDNGEVDAGPEQPDVTVPDDQDYFP